MRVEGSGSGLDEDRVAEAEASSRQVLAAEAAEELIVPAATEDGAQLARAIEALEDDPSVVGQAAHLGRVCGGAMVRVCGTGVW